MPSLSRSLSDSSSQRLLLIDAYALLYRSYFSHQRNVRVNSKGFPTGTIFGFANTLFDVLSHHRPSHVCMGFDRSGKTFRHALYTDYKAHRQEEPEEITASLPYIRRFLSALRIPIRDCKGYEADDVIGTLCVWARSVKGSMEVVLFTSDKDFAQLVGSGVFLLRPGGSLMGKESIKEHYGIFPAQVVDFLALQGDAADNIPGVRGVGKKTAQQLLNDYGSLEGIYTEGIEKVSASLRAKLLAGKESAYLSQKLATICTTVPMDVKKDDLVYRDYDSEALRALFSELEFRTLSQRILKEELTLFPVSSSLRVADSSRVASKDVSVAMQVPLPQALPSYAPRYRVIADIAACKALVSHASEASQVSLHFLWDAETPFFARPKALGCCYGLREAFVILWQEDEAFLSCLRPLFGASAPIFITMQAKADRLIAARYGLPFPSRYMDLTLAHYLLQSEGSHRLSSLVSAFLPDTQQYYALEDEMLVVAQQSHQIFCLYSEVKAALVAAKLEDLYGSLELPLIEVLAAMERKGICLDSQALLDLSEVYKGELLRLAQQIYDLAGKSFAILSPKQLGEVLFVDLQLSAKPKKTRTGMYATSEDILQGLQSRHEIVPKVLAYRALQKLHSTYVEALPRYVAKEDGRIHTDFRQSVAATGRLSSHHPNIQNIPIRTPRGRQMRKAFVAPPSHMLLSADYSQIELRIIAALAEEKTMLSAFSQGIDVHRLTAERLFKVQEVDESQRRVAKTTNFGIIYGISAFGLSKSLGISRYEAQQFITDYFQQFPQIQAYMEESKVRAREKGYVETIFGRRRYLPDITSRNAATRGFAERNAINAPIQGTAADIIKKAMIQVHAYLLKNHPRAHLIVQIHDELLIESPNEEVRGIQKALPALMENVAPSLQVPLHISLGMGKDWMDAHR